MSPSPAISIIALEDPVAIVHIPLHLAELTASKLYWTVNNAPDVSNEFFNVTANRIEVAVFARTDLINAHWAGVESPDIKISSAWRVFEISSGDLGQTSNYDSPHLRCVSAPLSRAGISILYQSSYFTDYLLVKESDFVKTSQIFASHGWHIDPSDSHTRRRSQLLSPITPIHSTPTASPMPHPPVPELTVLPSPLACVGFSHETERATAERINQLVVWPGQARASWQAKRSRGHAPSYDAATPLPSAQASGLDSVAEIGEKGGRPFMSYTRTQDGASITTETKILRWMFGKKMLDNVFPEDADGGGDDGEDVSFQLGGRLSLGYVTDATDIESDSDDSDGDDEPYSADHVHCGESGIPEAELRGRKGVSEDDGDSLSDISSSTGLRTPSSDIHPLTLGDRKRPLSLPVTPKEAGGHEVPISWCRSTHARRSTISLKSEVDKRRTSWEKHIRAHDSISGEEDIAHEARAGRKRCLQLDLRGVDEDHPDDGAYHLDKSGLVTRFSDLLDSSSIRMLYSSTFHTANILVEARDVVRAKKLLEGRGRGKRLSGEGYF